MEREDFKQQVKNLVSHAMRNNEPADDVAQAVLEMVIELNDEMKKCMYEMPAVTTIQVEDQKLDVLTKYQVASLINCYPHTYFDEAKRT